MVRKDNQKQTQAGAEDELEGNVDQIRQILFGGKMRDYEKRFGELENRLTKSIEQLSSRVEKRIDRLDSYTKREIDKLTDQLKIERKARGDDDKKNSSELEHFVQQVEGWFSEVEENLDSEIHSLRASLKEQGEELSGEIEEAAEQISSSLEGEAREIADSKLAREDLAAIFSELALRLKKDFKLPKG